MTSNTEPPPRRLYGRRSARRLRPGRRALLEQALPRYAVDLRSESAASAPVGRAPRALDPAALFARPMRALWLEVGFGGGEHLAWQAARRRDVGFIGCEPFMNGVASLLRHIQDRGLDNVRVCAGDARDLMDRLPAAAVGRAFVLFPDPWPKFRHRGRRFVCAANLDALARVMADGAELRLATDDATQLRWMLRLAPAHPAFEWLARGPADWRTRPDDWPPTRYETKALEQGRRPTFLRLRRRARAGGA